MLQQCAQCRPFYVELYFEVFTLRIFTARRYASAVLGVVILPVRHTRPL